MPSTVLAGLAVSAPIGEWALAARARRHPPLRPLRERGIVKPEVVAATALRMPHRNIGVRQRRRSVAPVMRKNRDADAGREDDFAAAEHRPGLVRLVQGRHVGARGLGREHVVDAAADQKSTGDTTSRPALGEWQPR